MTTTDQLSQRKNEIRKAAHAARKEQAEKDSISQQITDRVMELDEYRSADCVMWYVDVRDEARTRHALPAALASGKRIVIPYCVDGELALFHLQSMDELEIGMYKILEPRADLRDMDSKRVDVKELDLILVPGVAFDDRGGRTGHGKGYYDKLLENAKPETPLISLAFECQMFDKIPMQDHDIYMDKVVTEARVCDGIGRVLGPKPFALATPRRRPEWATQMTDLRNLVDDTYAEGFRSIYGEILITARDQRWLTHCVNAVTGHSSSTILCDCEAGVSQWIDADAAAAGATPDGRIGATVQFHVPRFVNNRRDQLQKVMLARISQNVLTCPTARCFNRIDSDDYFKLGRKIALFGDRYQFRDQRYGERGWVIPIMGGEFFLSRRFGYRDGVMGGNLWFFGPNEETALDAAERAAIAVEGAADVITTFPGGVAASGSKAGSSYDFLVAATYAEFCPSLREKLGEQSKVPEGVNSIMEIIVNGRDLEAIKEATKRAIVAAAETPGLRKISAGNYAGRLGKSFIQLHELI